MDWTQHTWCWKCKGEHCLRNLQCSDCCNLINNTSTLLGALTSKSRVFIYSLNHWCLNRAKSLSSKKVRTLFPLYSTSSSSYLPPSPSPDLSLHSWTSLELDVPPLCPFHLLISNLTFTSTYSLNAPWTTFRFHFTQFLPWNIFFSLASIISWFCPTSRSHLYRFLYMAVTRSNFSELTSWTIFPSHFVIFTEAISSMYMPAIPIFTFPSQAFLLSFRPLDLTVYLHLPLKGF